MSRHHAAPPLPPPPSVGSGLPCSVLHAWTFQDRTVYRCQSSGVWKVEVAAPPPPQPAYDYLWDAGVVVVVIGMVAAWGWFWRRMRETDRV